MATHVLRVKRTDIPGQHLLLHISSNGSKQLDLKFIGTEHEHLYHAVLKEANVKSLQAGNYSGDLNEWKSILRHALLHETSAAGATFLQGLETVAAINNQTLTITFRKNISGITQRLGSITLQQDDEREEISAFEWVDTAVSTGDDLRTQLETLQASVSGQQDEVAKLNQQLDDLVKAKKEHEEELLKKFVALLNAKKLKIRDQMRLLNGARVDAGAAEEVRTARNGTGRRAEGSRRGKRIAAVEDDENEDEVDETENGGEEEGRQEETPPRSGAEDATDDEADDLDSAVVSSARNGLSSQTMMDVDKSEELPPRRELPFGKKTAQPAGRPEPVAHDDDEDDETDDEL